MEPFLGQIQVFGFNFAPRGWAKCDGTLLAISQYQALFSLLGTTYGGDGRTTFGLPDMRGRVSSHQGTGPGLSPRSIGQKMGEENTTLTNANQIPSHSHTVSGANVQGDDTDPTTGNGFGIASNDLYLENEPGTAMGAGTIQVSGGGSQGHNTMQPTLVLNYCIALVGTFPSRN